MEHTEFTNQIDKHKAILKRNYIAIEIIGYMKLLLSLLIGASIMYLFLTNFKTGIVGIILAEALAVTILWIYSDKLRGKINHSNEIIIIYKGHMYRLSDICEAFPRVDQSSLDDTFQIPEEQDIIVDLSFIDFMEKIHKGQIVAEEQRETPLYAKNHATKFFLM